MNKHPELKDVMKRYVFDMEDLWDRLEKTARRLETIAHKQLREVKLNDREVQFIMSYGETIAGIMLYGGNSYSHPRDDAPRVVDVYFNPEVGGYLHVGIARPRKLYVLYPWRNEVVLCVGAVLPYYEFVDTVRLTDESWKAKLDSDQRPSIVPWLRSIVTDHELKQPHFGGRK